MFLNGAARYMIRNTTFESIGGGLEVMWKRTMRGVPTETGIALQM